jgi:hypothetical protein
MTKTLITKESLAEMINNASPERKVQIVGRAMVALFNRQVAVEQVRNEAVLVNFRGFCSQDARQGCITAKYFLKHGKLEGWMIDQWTKCDRRGTPRLVKYWRQLNEVAEEKAA